MVINVSKYHRRAALFFAVVLLVSAFGAFPVQAAKQIPSFFNTVEKSSKNLKPFKKWTAVLKRYSKELKNKKDITCKTSGLNICDYGDWAKFLKSLKGKDKITQIREVNARMNKATYITDDRNWGKKDFWATPGEFMARFGDCEDFAIAKYLSLRILGIPDRNMRIVAVKDLNLKVGHAILVIIFKDRKSKKRRFLVLDNQIKKVIDSRKIRHYQPVFSINKSKWWRHTKATG